MLVFLALALTLVVGLLGSIESHRVERADQARKSFFGLTIPGVFIVLFSLAAFAATVCKERGDQKAAKEQKDASIATGKSFEKLLNSVASTQPGTDLADIRNNVKQILSWTTSQPHTTELATPAPVIPSAQPDPLLQEAAEAISQSQVSRAEDSDLVFFYSATYFAGQRQMAFDDAEKTKQLLAKQQIQQAVTVYERADGERWAVVIGVPRPKKEANAFMRQLRSAGGPKVTPNPVANWTLI